MLELPRGQAHGRAERAVSEQGAAVRDGVVRHDVVRLEPEHVELAGELLGRAFFDDPFSRYVVPDLAERPDSLPFLFEVGVRYGVLFGEVYAAYAAYGELRGVAVWLPPGGHRTTPERGVEAGFLELGDLLEPETLHRFGRLQSYLGEVHERDAPTDHWYLMLLGVEPACQGRGIGGALIRPILARADEGAVPCYLETYAEGNVRYYARHGFVLVTAGVEPSSGERFWTMRRDPASVV